MQRNKDEGPWDSRLRWMASFLREWSARQARIAYRQALRGAAYSLGSGAVSLLILWFEARH